MGRLFLKPDRAIRLVCLCVLIAGIVLVFVLFSLASSSRTLKYSVVSKNVGFGASGLSDEGWLVPGNVSFYTSYNSNVSLNGFVSGYIDVFSYHIQQNTSVYLGLYVNGVLEATQTYAINSLASAQAQALSTVAANVTTFSHSLWSYPVVVKLNNSLPAGSEITLVAVFNKSVWIQIDPGTLVQSYQITSPSLPPAVLPTFSAESQAAYTVSVGVETNA